MLSVVASERGHNKHSDFMCSFCSAILPKPLSLVLNY